MGTEHPKLTAVRVTELFCYGIVDKTAFFGRQRRERGVDIGICRFLELLALLPQAVETALFSGFDENRVFRQQPPGGFGVKQCFKIIQLLALCGKHDAGPEAGFDLLRSLSCLDHCITHQVCCSCRQSSCVLDLVYDHIWQRRINIIHAVNTQKSYNGPLCGYRCMTIDEFLHVVGDICRMLAGAVNNFLVKIKFAFHPISPYLIYFFAPSMIALSIPSMAAIFRASLGTCAPFSTRCRR